MKKISLAAITLLIPAFVFAADMKINREISTLVNKISASYKQGKDILMKKNLAIADFENISETAKKEKLGESVSELLSSRFSQTTIFNLVERKNLDKILKEQELQLTGATDQNSAVNIGNLLNADALVYGSITELGDMFNITVKLVDVETGKVISETVSVEKKEMITVKEDLLDMQYVKKMGVGISVNFLGGTMAGNVPTINPFPGFGETGLYRRAGVEVKYRFTKWLMFGTGIDMMWGQLFFIPNQPFNASLISPIAGIGSGPFVIDAKGIGIPILLYFNYSPLRWLNLFVAAGVEYYNITLLGYYQDNRENPLGGGKGFGVNQIGPQMTFETAIGVFRLGVEFFITPRLALSLTVGYDLGWIDLNFANQVHLTNLQKNTNNGRMELGGFFWMPSISFYF